MALTTLLVSQIISCLVLFWSTLFVGLAPSLIGHWFTKRNSVGGTQEDDIASHKRGDKNIPSRDVPTTHADHESIFPGIEGQESEGDGPPLSGSPDQRKLIWDKILSFFMNFGGGVLFATSVLHMLPEINEKFGQIHDHDQHSHDSHQVNASSLINSTASKEPSTLLDGQWTLHFLSPELLICLGFFLIYSIEELMHIILAHPGHGHSHTASVEDIKSQYWHNHHDHRHSHTHSDLMRSLPDSRQNRPSYGSTAATSEKTKLLDDNSDETRDQTLKLELAAGSDHNPSGNCGHSHADGHSHSNSGSEDFNAIDSTSILKCVLLVFALSFHSIFDGVAIGLQPNVTAMIQLSFAILIHKLPIAFVVGCDVYSKTSSPKIVFFHLFPFSLMSPIGIIVASSLTFLDIDDRVVGSLTAISTGSLIYITFFEILLREKMESKLSSFAQFVSMVTGFTLMTIVLEATPHVH